MPPRVVEVTDRRDGELTPIESSVQNHVAESSVLLCLRSEDELGPIDPRHSLQVGFRRQFGDGIAGDREGPGIDPEDGVTVFTRSPKGAVFVPGKPRQPGNIGV